MLQLERRGRRALLHHALQQRDHGAGGRGADHVGDLRITFLADVAVVVGDLADVARGHADAIVREGGEGGGLFEERDFGGAQGHGQVCRDRRGDAELARILDDRLDADLLGDLQCRDVARVGDRFAQRDVAPELAVVVRGCIGAGGGHERRRRIEDGVIGRDGLGVDGGGVDERLEGRPYLAERLRRAIELGVSEVAPADHGLDVAGGVVEGQQCDLGAGVLLERDLELAAGLSEGEHFHIDEVTGLEKVRDGLLRRPLDLRRPQDCRERADAQIRGVAGHGGDERIDVGPGRNALCPVRMLILLQRGALREHILKLALPSVAAFVGRQTVKGGLVGGLLPFKVERGVYAQAVLVDVFRAVFLFQVTADLLYEIWSDGVRQALDVQRQGRVLGAGGDRRGDLAVFEHGVDHEVTPALGVLRIRDGRVLRGRFGEAGQHRRLLQGQVFRPLAEVVLGARLKAINAVSEVDLIGVHGEDLRLGEAALDLDGKDDLLHLAAEALFRGEEKIAGELHGQGRSSLGAALGAEVAVGGAYEALQVDAPVFLKVLVLDGEDGLAQHRGEVFIRGDDAALQGKGPDDASLVIVDLGDGAGAVALEFAGLRKVRGVHDEEPGDGADEGRTDEQNGEEEASDEGLARDLDRREIGIEVHRGVMGSG